MQRQQQLKHRLQTLAALQDAVGAMRSLSAHHFRQARQALPAARVYRDEIDEIMSQLDFPTNLATEAPAGLLVISSDLGLCGNYTSRLIQQAVVAGQQLASPAVYSVGRRGRSILTQSGLPPIRSYAAPASLEGLGHLLLGLSQDVLEDFLSRQIGGLHLVSSTFQGVGHFTPMATTVLPLAAQGEKHPHRGSPYVSDGHLATVALGEYLYITLYEALLDAMAAEHGMRLMAAESALEWLEHTVSSTARHLASARSEAGTQELLDIITGGRRLHRKRQQADLAQASPAAGRKPAQKLPHSDRSDTNCLPQDPSMNAPP
ncbi:MAG: F0F1 ATP synthase subunit gamma [Planctomycetales bacterium]|nr:F0F1 ATP synthase subunit gamma [Planctomycetales bacterium]